MLILVYARGNVEKNLAGGTGIYTVVRGYIRWYGDKNGPFGDKIDV